jgi:hypothetical protein
MLVNGQKDADSVEGKVSEFCEKIDTIQQILRRYYGDKGLKVKTLECTEGSKDGDNYMSLIKRIFAKIKTSNNTGECIKSLRDHIELLVLWLGGEG